MSKFVPWNSQPLELWAARHAPGQSIELDGHRTHYIVKGEGRPVILIHGFIYDSTIWAENIDALATAFRVYALDLWGQGYSTREPLDYGYPLFAHQLRCFMDALGIQRASLVAQSMGGGTAITLAVQHPERVEKLLLVDPAGMPGPVPFSGKLFALPGAGELALSLPTDAVRRMVLRMLWIHDKKLVTDRYLADVTRFHKIAGTTEVELDILRREFFHTLSAEIEQLAQLPIPVLLVWGREDKTVPLARGEAMHQILAGSRLEIIDNAGHVPNYEAAAEFNRLALDFLRE
jgi:pimeloyl-ACP methyl ester carboxylesterase